MTDNSKNKTNMLSKLDDKTLNEISQLVSTIDNSQLKNTTAPSPILVGGIEEISLAKLDPRDIEKYLWMHPIVPRGIEIKANSMIRRGYRVNPSSDSSIAKKCAEDMKEIIDNSGGLITIKKWVEDAYGFGTGFRTLVTNKAGNKVLRLNREHPIYFRIAKYPKNHPNKNKRGKYKIDLKTKEPIAFTQVIWDDMHDEWVQVGNEIPAERVAPLYFDTWGDEVQGISLIQYVHLTLKYLLNIEEAGAETTFRNGFVQKKVTTDITNEKDLKKLGKNITNINRRDAIILPRGTDVENLNPGTTQFDIVHKVFVRLLASRLGIPLPHLEQDGTQTNKATITQLTKLMYDDFSADELIVKHTIENYIFKPACRLQYGPEFSDIPSFEFLEVSEDSESRAERLSTESTAILNLTNAAKNLVDINKNDESDLILEYLREYFELDDKLELAKKNNKRQ